MKNSTNFVIWHVCIKLLAQKVFNNFLHKKTNINWYTALQMNTLAEVLIWKTIKKKLIGLKILNIIQKQIYQFDECLI